LDPHHEQGWYWAGAEGTTDLVPWHERRKTARKTRQHDERPREKLPYEIVLQGEPIALDAVEYRIVQILASKPYHAFTPEQITSFVNQKSELMQPAKLQDHIFALRHKMGFFRDYVQSVPYIGYRFKP
jgi:DNA-binding response OmpR family regulator